MAEWPPLVSAEESLWNIKDLTSLTGDQLASLAAAAAADVRAYCRWHIAPVIVDDVLTISAHGRRTLDLPTKRILAVSSVTSDGYLLDLVNDVEWDESGMLRRRYGRFSNRLRGVTVTLTHGYEKCPADLLPALAAVVSRGRDGLKGDFARMQLGPLAAEAAQGDGGAPAGMALLSEERRRLARYRVPVVG